MKNDSSKTPHNSYLESLGGIAKSLNPLAEALSEIGKEYENIDGLKSVSAVWKAAYTSFEVSEYYKQSVESFKEIGRQLSEINMEEEYRKSLDSFQNIAKSLMSVSVIDMPRLIQNLQELMKLFKDSAASEQLSQLESIEYGKIYFQTLEAGGTFKDAVDVVYESLQEKENIPENIELETDFANEQEIKDTINDQINNPVGFQERIANWAGEKRKKYYIVVVLWRMIFNIFIVTSLQDWGTTVTTKVVSSVKELPQKGAEIIYQLKENFEATIIENTNYYYKITFTDDEGVQREGYVAKRNLKIVKEPETEEEPSTTE